ncbi:MAG: LCP family protein, partial [Alkaliphilus sp.]|nr:LCP family protein [Alkaliphilus sp.]
MKKFLKTFIFAFIIFVLIMVLGYYVFLNSISKGQGTENKDAPADGEPVNILIVGVDAKDTNASEGARTDTIMLATFNPTSKLLDIISIPRDTRVKIAGRKGEDKINHAYAFGGIENAIETVEGFLNVKINYYVKVDYKGLIKLVDDIGGIEIDVPMDMKYNDPYSDPPIKIDLKKG